MKLLSAAADALMRVTAALAILALMAFAASAQVAPTEAPTVVTEAEVTTVTTSAEGDDTTIINTPDGEATTIEMPDNTTVVTIPAGDIISKVLGWAREIIITAAVAGAAWAGRLLPKTLANWLLQEIVNRNLVRAIDYGINAVSGATKGMALSVNVGSAVVAEALQYFVDQAPGWLVKMLGGPDRIRDMVIARIPLDSEATAQAVVEAINEPWRAV